MFYDTFRQSGGWHCIFVSASYGSLNDGRNPTRAHSGCKEQETSLKTITGIIEIKSAIMFYELICISL